MGHLAPPARCGAAGPDQSGGGSCTAGSRLSRPALVGSLCCLSASSALQGMSWPGRSRTRSPCGPWHGHAVPGSLAHPPAAARWMVCRMAKTCGWWCGTNIRGLSREGLCVWCRQAGWEGLQAKSAELVCLGLATAARRVCDVASSGSCMGTCVTHAGLGSRQTLKPVDVRSLHVRWVQSSGRGWLCTRWQPEGVAGTFQPGVQFANGPVRP